MADVSYLVSFAGDNAQCPHQPEIWLTSSGVGFESENQACYAEQIYFLLTDWQSGELKMTFPDVTFDEVQKAIAEILADAFAHT